MSHLVLLSGPSGVGKTTISIAAADRLGARLGVSHTTRPIRSGEIDGESYHFIAEDAFLRLRDDGWLMEWTRYPDASGDFYGLAVSEWVAAVSDHQDLLVVMEPNGVRDVRAWMGRHGLSERVVTIYVMPASFEELAGRMADRGDEPEAIAARLDHARYTVMREATGYDFTVFNGDGQLDDAIESVCRIVRGLRTGLEVVR